MSNVIVMLKRSFVFLLACCMMVTLFGCNDSSEEYSYYSSDEISAQNGDTTDDDFSDREIGTGGATAAEKKSGLISKAKDSGKNASDGTVKESIDIGAKGTGQSSDITLKPRNLKDKTVYVFSWRDPATDEFKKATNVAKKKYGMTIKWISTTHNTYWSDLTSLVAAGQRVDLMDLEWDFYPRAFTSGLAQPLDEYIDFDTDLWSDFSAVINKYAYKDRIYFGIQNAMISGLVYYNPRTFKEMGLKTPRQYWEEDKWTLQTMVELSNKLVKKDKAGNVTRLGMTPDASLAPGIAGVDIVEPNRQSNYKLNIKNSRIAKVMNALNGMGVNGTGSAGITNPTGLVTNDVAMACTASWGTTTTFTELHKKNQLEFCIYPKLDDKSSYYYAVSAYPRWGLVKGSKNPEGAAFYVEINKWTYLGQPWINDLPYPETAYTKEFEKGSSTEFTKSEIEYINKLLSQNYPLVVSNFSHSAMGDQSFPGISEVLNGSDWSSIVAKKEPEIKAILNAYYK